MAVKKKDDNVAAEDLEKSLELLEKSASEGDNATRKEELLAKATEGDLEKADRDELFQILGGAPSEEVTPTVSEDLVKSMTDEANDGLQEALDVSPYLKGLHEGLAKSLEAVGEHIEKSDRRSHEMEILQSRALVEMGHLVKSMSERLGIIETQPVRGPKSKGITPDQTLAKSFDGGTTPGGEGGEELTKSDIAEALDSMMIESMEGGKNGLSKSGQDILLQVSHFESHSKLSPSMFGDVKEFIGRRKAAH